jgi:hypothetical protein
MEYISSVLNTIAPVKLTIWGKLSLSGYTDAILQQVALLKPSTYTQAAALAEQLSKKYNKGYASLWVKAAQNALHMPSHAPMEGIDVQLSLAHKQVPKRPLFLLEESIDTIPIREKIASAAHYQQTAPKNSDTKGGRHLPYPRQQSEIDVMQHLRLKNQQEILKLMDDPHGIEHMKKGAGMLWKFYPPEIREYFTKHFGTTWAMTQNTHHNINTTASNMTLDEGL